MMSTDAIEASIVADWPSLDELSLRYLRIVLAHTNGNKTAAAKILCINRRTLTRILATAARTGRTPTMYTTTR